MIELHTVTGRTFYINPDYIIEIYTSDIPEISGSVLDITGYTNEQYRIHVEESAQEVIDEIKRWRFNYREM